ncbi:Transducin beta-like protein 3 [Glycine max]|uniref:uncharacterized protein n=1 Tax=Glycine max TaxID=3847 RepID=UPI00071926D8|nr:uncharacterized protein LOC102665314 [Glycine max]KAH1193528.1 Transducin beta-like protein 3 [Glycine max]|eukprot:XP_014626953.1 uncharacterized protein LOC102665314 isoform X2 [Glycine max]
MDGLSDNMTMPINLKAKAVVAAHDKDINSVAVAPNDSLVCSGSQEEGVVKGQELENAVSDADYTKAIQIAFELRRPHRLFELFAELCRKRVAENHMDRALKGLGGEELRILFNYI